LCSAIYAVTGRLEGHCGSTLAGLNFGSRRPIGPGKATMVKNFEDMQKFGKDNMDATLNSFGVWSKGFQTIAAEMADYAKKAFEDGAAAAEKLLGAKSLDKAIEVQSDYMKTSYEHFLSHATKFGELYAGLAQEAYKPFENYMARASAK
jgi:phasin family protein